MPPFLRLIPLPRHLTTDLPSPVAAGIGLAVSLPAATLRLAISLPRKVVGTGIALVGHYGDLAALGTSLVRGRSDDEDAPEPLPSYALDTSAWGAPHAEVAEVIALFEAASAGNAVPVGEAAGRAPGERPKVPSPAVTAPAAAAPSTAVADRASLPDPAPADAVADAQAAADDTTSTDAAADQSLAAVSDAPPTKAKTGSKTRSKTSSKTETGSRSGSGPAFESLADSDPSTVAEPAPAGGLPTDRSARPRPSAKESTAREDTSPAAGLPAASSAETAGSGTTPAVIARDTSPAARFLAAAATDRTQAPASNPDRAELPVDGYDGLSAAGLRSKLAGLSTDQLAVLRDYEAGHAKRITVLQLLERSIAKAAKSPKSPKAAKAAKA